jgi:hypothetical protein
MVISSDVGKQFGVRSRLWMLFASPLIQSFMWFFSFCTSVCPTHMFVRTIVPLCFIAILLA